MVDHIYHSRGAWQATPSGCFAAVDFSKAYDSVDHEYAKAFFSAIGLPPDLSSLLLHLFKSPYILNVAGRIDTTQKKTHEQASDRVTRSPRPCFVFSLHQPFLSLRNRFQA